MPAPSQPPDRLLLRPATSYETVAALLHHQPAAAFASLFVLHGYGHELCPQVTAADIAEIEASVEGHDVRRSYHFQRLVLQPLQSNRRIDFSHSDLQLHCFDRCSIRQFPVFFVFRDAADQVALEAMLERIVGLATVRYHDWRLANAYEWTLLCRAASEGQLQPVLGFELMDVLGWRLVRPITELGGQSPVLEWHLMKAFDLAVPGALPLMTVLTDTSGRLLRKADAQMLTVFRAKTARLQPLHIRLAEERAPLIRVGVSIGSAEAPRTGTSDDAGPKVVALPARPSVGTKVSTAGERQA